MSRAKIRRRPFRAGLDHLEDRRVLSAYGNPWPDPMHLTLSFAPDGTHDAGQPSAMYQTMGQAGTASAWQGAILKAYQTWAASTNLNITVKVDGGQDMGTYGSIQGDSRFGDIRIGAISQAPGVLAVAQPFSYAGGTWSGDVNFNSADILSLDGHSGSIDLYTLALHEAGHSLGIDDSTDASSAMYDQYTGPRTGISSSDIAAIQALYGTPGVSPSGNTQLTPSTTDTVTNGYINDDANANDTPRSATYLYSANAASGTFNLLYRGSLTPTDSLDYYRFNTPHNAQTVMTVSVWGLDANAVSTAVTILDGSGNPVAANVVANGNGRVAVQIPQMKLKSTYYIKVNSDVPAGAAGATGNYALAISYSSVADSETRLGSGTMTPTGTGSAATWSTPAAMTLNNDVNGVVHFNLAADSGGVAQDAGVQLTITDANGVVVATLQARANRTRSLELWLAKGTYTLTVSAINTASTSAAPLNWALDTEKLSDPMLSMGYTGGGSSSTTYPTGQQPPPPPPPSA